MLVRTETWKFVAYSCSKGGGCGDRARDKGFRDVQGLSDFFELSSFERCPSHGAIRQVPNGLTDRRDV